MLQEHSSIQQEVIKANRYFQAADHMASVTFNLVKDQKLLIAIAENLHLSFSHAIDALLQYERLYKRIPPYSENSAAKLELFKNRVAPLYNLNRGYLIVVEELRELIQGRKTAPIEFIRQDKYVICNPDYSKINVITLEKLKSYINESKPFMRKLNLILQNVRK